MEQPAFLKEIEKSRVDEERDGNDQPNRRRYTYHSFLDRKSSSNASNTIGIDNAMYQPVDHSYVQMKDSPQLSKKTVRYARSLSLDSDKLPTEKDDTDAGVPEFIMKEGWLHRTSQLKNSKTKGRNRQHRNFKLTPHSLEYNHYLQKVKVKKQYPLTSIVHVVYDETENPAMFKLELQKIEVILEARNQTDCKQWVEAIKKAWKLWKQFNVAEKDVTSVDEITENESSYRPEQKEYLKKNKDYLEQAKKNLGCTTPGLVTTPKVAEKCFSSAPQQSKGTAPNTDEQSVESATHPKHSGLQRFQARIGLAPRIQKSIDQRKSIKQWKSFSHAVGADNNAFALLNKHSFVMIKYPRRKGYSLPHERVFKMDFENLLIMWHQTEDSTFNYLRTLKTENIVDVRDGQDSDGFDRYPYEEMGENSLSILFEGEKQTVPGGRYYAVLQSLDLICDSSDEQKLWYHVLKQFISPKYRLYSSRYESTDPTIMLVTHWSTLNKGEIREDTALSFGSSHVPQIKRHKMEKLLAIAHECQLKEAEHHGHSLHWDGFILFFILLCGIDESSCRLLNIFESYTKTYPSLGMTVEEFQKFLTESQHWSSKDATNEKCVQLMVRYDYHYRAYKMHKADSSPFEFNLSLCLLSFGGFLSFIRSPDNSVINREHEEPYQDMSQPLSHYFINSSHNTYLEGHQLIGRSTTDAYVRALLQGCRCLELDCWDGPDGQPRITHGNTPVSDLSLEEVAKTIDKYAFNVSIYPLILSLENHCSPDQQAEMVEIFKKEFGQKLLTMEENFSLLKVKGLDRLPSPQQLQGKIILKGTDPHSSNITPQRTFLNRITRRNQKPKSTKRKAIRVNVSSSIKNPFQFPSRYHPQSNETTPKGDKTQEVDDDNEDIIESDLTEGLSDLIVYCRTKRIKPWDWDKQKATTVYNMFSFNDHSATTNCTHSTKMLACTERQFVRTYPHGTRIDSSNYDPIPLWNHGIHMVALNVQTPDTFMFLNQGKFRQNGGCGYVLKPEVMRNPDGTDYKPNMKEPLKEVTPVNLTITPLSGQHFIVPSKRTVSMEIQYETYGIEHDCEKKKYTTANSNITNPLWPQFKDASKLEKTIYMPELCLVLFAVNIRVSRKLQAGTKLIMLGQNVFPLTSLKPGLRYIPLRTPGGESTSHIGIFVEIKMSKLSHQQASSSGLCSLKDLKSPVKRFSSPRFLETYRFGEGETTVDTVGDEENILHIKETTVSPSSLSNGSTDANRRRNQPRMIRQGAISQCTAEIHVNPLTEE